MQIDKAVGRERAREAERVRVVETLGDPLNGRLERLGVFFRDQRGQADQFALRARFEVLALAARFRDALDHEGGRFCAVVLEHASMTDFCGIPLVSLRENSITELPLEDKGIGVPGAIVLSKLLPSAAALTSLRCVATPGSPRMSEPHEHF